eukprot:6023772-Amphidinium_carterae.1
MRSQRAVVAVCAYAFAVHVGLHVPAIACIPPGHLKSCLAEFDPSDVFTREDEAMMHHYKKTGLVGSIRGTFGDKKTMYCHHMTANNAFAVKAAGNRRFSSEAQVWKYLGKEPCCGRFFYDSRARLLQCGSLEANSHDETCNDQTCLFVKNGLRCPVPRWALK